jgi:hypothetical protein
MPDLPPSIPPSGARVSLRHALHRNRTAHNVEDIMATEAVAFGNRTPARLLALALILLLTACKSGPSPGSNLRVRIASVSTSQKCLPPDECINPHILSIESGYFITTFAGAKPQYAQVRAEALRDYLVGLPMSAWPRGPMILLSATDDVTDWRAVQLNLEEAQRICRSLNLDVKILPGG